MPETPQAAMKRLGILTCGSCKHFKDFQCMRTPLQFPSLKSDPCCGKFLSKR